MEKASVFFKRIMLGVLLAVLGLSFALIVREGVGSRSYLYALALGAAAGPSLLAALGPAWRSTKIEPSEVIRDV